MADFRLYRGEDVYVTGDPAEASKLRHQGWSTEPPKPAPRPRPVEQKTPEQPKPADPKTSK